MKETIEIKVSTKKQKDYSFLIMAKELIINWGDGEIEEHRPNGYGIEYKHVYAGKKLYTILVKAKEVKYIEIIQDDFIEVSLGDCPHLTDMYCCQNYFYSTLTHLSILNAPKLVYLNCSYGFLKELDLSGCPNLIHLTCSGNSFETLDISKNVLLEELRCHYNHLVTLDLSMNIYLKDLECYENKLTSLDLSNNLNLEELSVDNNCLKSLDLSANTKLVDLSCYENQLTSLDLTNNTSLRWLECVGNNFTAGSIRVKVTKDKINFTPEPDSDIYEWVE